MLPGVAPVEGGHVVVAHPHEALAAQHRLDGARARLRRRLRLRVLRDRHPAQHRLAQPARSGHTSVLCRIHRRPTQQEQTTSALAHAPLHNTLAASARVS